MKHNVCLYESELGCVSRLRRQVEDHPLGHARALRASSFLFAISLSLTSCLLPCAAYAHADARSHTALVHITQRCAAHKHCIVYMEPQPPQCTAPCVVLAVTRVTGCSSERVVPVCAAGPGDASLLVGAAALLATGGRLTGQAAGSETLLQVSTDYQYC